jgi:hypothetical protein
MPSSLFPGIAWKERSLKSATEEEEARCGAAQSPGKVDGTSRDFHMFLLFSPAKVSDQTTKDSNMPGKDVEHLRARQASRSPQPVISHTSTK